MFNSRTIERDLLFIRNCRDSRSESEAGIVGLTHAKTHQSIAEDKRADEAVKTIITQIFFQLPAFHSVEISSLLASHRMAPQGKQSMSFALMTV